MEKQLLKKKSVIISNSGAPEDTVFSDVTPYRMVDIYRCFGETHRPHLQGMDSSFYPKARDKWFFTKVGKFPPHYMASRA